MGQKVNPISFRINFHRTWDSRWYADRRNYAVLLLEDLSIRKFVEKRLYSAGVSRVVIERPAGKCRVNISCARPGLVIGKKGADIDKLRVEISKFTKAEDVQINISEVKKPEVDPKLIAEGIAKQLENRASYRRVVKRAMQSAERMGAKGVKIACSGRLGGIDIARTEWYRNGSVPLHTLKADVLYGHATAHTTYGACGVKVWIYLGKPVEVQKKVERQ
jgi:small subunit ribosomal protein S3